MEQPKGFVATGQEHLVCRLRKSLYGLKQAPRQWYKKFDDFIRSVGFSKSDEDHCLFTKTAQDGSPVFLIIYVDDMLLSGLHTGELTELVRKLQLKFAMMDLGSAWHILGMKISRNRAKRQLFLSQTDPTTNSPSAFLARLPDIRFGGGRYEVGTVCTGSRLSDVRNGRDTA